MLPPTHPDDAAFEEALAGFQDNVATATRCLYAKLALNHFASQATGASSTLALRRGPKAALLVRPVGQGWPHRSPKKINGGPTGPTSEECEALFVRGAREKPGTSLI